MSEDLCGGDIHFGSHGAIWPKENWWNFPRIGQVATTGASELLNTIHSLTLLTSRIKVIGVTGFEIFDTESVLSVAIGTKLGSHEITALLGKGGMGEVYRARDTKLKRDVAIKILPDEFARDADRVARFQREAEVLASLNHPNIAAIYDLQEAHGSRYLVLELVEGETLADRIARGPIPVEEALDIAKNICEALEAAHEKGIIHRDLKPANVKIAPQGKVKVLDFGLAKALAGTATATTLSNSPTLVSGTMGGAIIGTAAYMSPEQARGRDADQRTDVFAFGCLLYEMLAARQAFQGEDVSDVLASVMKIEPDFGLLPPKLNPALQRLISRCLAKNRKDRWHAIADVRVELEAIIPDPHGAKLRTAVAAVRPPLWKRALPVVVAIILTAAITGVGVWNLKPSPPQQITRFTFTLGEGQQFTNPGTTGFAISPEGSQITYEANRQLYHRSMSEIEARPIPGTQSPQVIGGPLFSPDGRFVVFWSLADLALKKVSVSGGSSITLCPAPNFYGGSWGDSGILFALSGAIMRVSASGGKPEQLIAMKDSEIAYGPQILPGGEVVLFTVAKGQGSAWDNAQVVAQSLKTGERKILVERGTDGRYVSTGHIVYGLGGTLFAVPFDVRRLEVTAGPVPVVEGVRTTTFQFGGGLQFSFSHNGTLIYLPGPLSATGEQQVLALMDRKGNIERLKMLPRAHAFPRVSPDGKRVVFGSDNGKEAHIWIYELNGTIAPRQLTVGGLNRYPVWSADGEWVAYQSDREGDLGIFRQRADGAGTAQRLTKAEPGVEHIPDTWSHDGQNLSFTAFKSLTSDRSVQLTGEAAVWIYSLKDKKATVFAEAQGRALAMSAFSPDDRWLAYQSNETGRLQVWVQPFPATGARYPIVGGTQPFWSADGKELLYDGGGLIGVVNITTRPNFAFSEPMPVPRGPFLPHRNPVRNYDITPDGKHFIGVVAADQNQSGSPTAPQIQVVLQWFEELKQRVPVH